MVEFDLFIGIKVFGNLQIVLSCMNELLMLEFGLVTQLLRSYTLLINSDVVEIKLFKLLISLSTKLSLNFNFSYNFLRLE